MRCGRRRDCSLVGSIIFYNFSGTVDKACHPVFVKVAGAPMTARQLCRHLTRPLGTVTATACRAALANVGTASNYLIAALATESPSLASIGRVLDTLDCVKFGRLTEAAKPSGFLAGADRFGVPQ